MENNFFIPVSQPFQNIIHSIWQTNRKFPAQKEIIVPQGVVEIIFNFSEPSKIEAQIDNKQYLLARCFINGFNTFPIQIHLPDEQIFFGIRLHPVAIKYLFGVPAGEFANLSIDLSLIDSSILSIWHQLIEQRTFEERVSIVSGWVESRWLQASPQEQLLNWFLSNRDLEIPGVADLAKMLCYSPRQLSRKMRTLTGMNTEEVLLYKKFLRSIDLIHHTKMSLTEIAYCCQFTDQSHFIKTFKSLAMMIPGDYKDQKSLLPGHIFKNVR
jgi:AraC-like DNA-binding protein